MKKLIIAALCAVTLGAPAQKTFHFEGRVVNASGIPVKDAIVKYPKTGQSVTTGADGLFSISLPAREDSITCEIEGMQTYNDCLISDYKNVIVLTPGKSSWMPHETYVKNMEGTAKVYYEAGLKFIAGDSVNVPDYMKAFACFTRAANMEYPQAKYQLGKMFDEGTGIPQDHEKAVSWYEKASNNPEANMRLGIMYSEGIGVRQDYTQAARYFRRVVNKGDTIIAKKYMEDIFAKGLANKDDVFEPVPEINAKFPGGNEACMEWLRTNIRYPKACLEKGIHGRVIVYFDINSDGSISDIKVSRSPDPHLGIEAVRVVEMMPKWEPATKGGQKVRSHFTLPIMFRLNK